MIDPPLRILVFDEKPAIGDRLGDLLEPDGHVVLAEQDADKALGHLQRAAVDLVIVDGAAPPESQVDVVRGARLRGGATRVILLCDDDEQADRLRLRLGADRVISTPPKPEEVRSAVLALREPAAQAANPVSPRILVVDDDSMVLESVTDVLREHHTVAATSSPKEALRVLKNKPHEILLTDLLMDEMDGMELIRWARAIRPHLLAVVMTGYGTKETAIASVKEGAYDFLEKPLTPAIVLQTIGRAWRSVRSELDNRKLLEGLERANQQLQREMKERRKVETELLHAQKLEAVGQLAAGIAHEINTPLQFIGDNTRFVKDSLDQLLDLLDEALKPGEGDQSRLAPRVKEVGLSFLRNEIPQALAENLEGVQRLDGIVQAMREFAHPGTDEMSEIDLNRSLRTMATVSRSEWKYVADMVLDLQDDLPPVPALPGEINQAILNLIINAAHAIREVVGASGERGTITIRTRRRDELVEVQVTDTGNGIPEAVRDRVFEPFFTTKAVGEGTGQGLAIARLVVVRKHKGRMRFDTEEGRGTTFTILLPLQQADQG